LKNKTSFLQAHRVVPICNTVKLLLS